MTDPAERHDGIVNHGNELFRRLVESVHDYAIFALSAEGTITTWNPGAMRIKGYTAREAIGRHFSMFYPANDLARGWPDEELRQARVKGRFEDEGLRVRKDGSTFWASVVISPLLGTGGEPIGFSKVTRDLTERKESERRLEQSERTQRLLIESVRDHAIFLLDAAGFVRTWNKGCERVFMLDESEVAGKFVGVLYPDLEKVGGAPRNDLGSAAAAGVHHVHSRRRGSSGVTFPAEVTTTALKNDQGQLVGFVQVVRDMSHQDRVVALETEGKRINEFIAMLSHELRNPLAPIRNAANLLQRISAEPAVRRFADVIDRQVTHLTRLVDDLMDVSRITTGKIRLDLEIVDMGVVVEGAAHTVRPIMEAHGHSLKVSLPKDRLHVQGDASRLNQVFVNLLTNSVKYTPDGGDVDVSLFDGDGLVTVRVTDSGVGMADDLLQRAFEPFVQGTRSLDRAEGGLGIGLTLVKSIVQLHGGTVAAASGGSGEGTTMTVTMPICHVPQPPAAEVSHAISSVRRVLVVDDNEDAAVLLAECLKCDGHEVDVTHDGPSAIKAVQNGFPDLVVLDIGLPGMSGYDVARQMRTMPGGRTARIIAVTGYGQESDRVSSADAGFDMHLVKPVEAKTVSDYASAVSPAT